MKCYIYILLDPISNEIKYVGKTVCPKKRLRSHIYESKNPKYKKACWIKSILNKGLKPIMQVIDECDFEDSFLIEEMYIGLMKGWGASLTNLQSKSANGIGRHSKETRDKISNKLIGKVHSAETIAKITKSVTEAWKDEGLRAIQREQSTRLNEIGAIGTKGMVSKKRGIPLLDETKNKVSESLKKYYSENKSKKIWEPENKKDIINDYINSEMSVYDIGVKYGVNRNMITKMMNREGVKLRNDGSKKIKKDDLVLLLNKGLRTKDIAVELNCSIAQVEKYKREYKLTKICV